MDRTLENGMRFLVLPRSGAPTVSFVVQYTVGGVNEVLAVLLMARSQPYRWERVTTFLNPDADPLGAGQRDRWCGLLLR